MMTHARDKHTLSLDSLCFRHGEHVLFADITYKLKSGESLLITGNNGCGKSTLLRIITGLMSPARGSITWNAQSIDNNEEYRANMHYMGHRNGLKSALTVTENLRLLLTLHLKDPFTEINNVLTYLSLHSLQHIPIRHLSAGQQRRVALAKLLLIKKPLWILDEPLTSLDDTMQTLLQQMINDHLQQGGIAIISSHHALNKITNLSYHMKMMS